MNKHSLLILILFFCNFPDFVLSETKRDLIHNRPIQQSENIIDSVSSKKQVFIDTKIHQKNQKYANRLAKVCKKTNFVFAYFKNGGKDGLHLAGSNDGLNWMAFKNDMSFITPEISNDKLMRDPCLIRDLNGVFQMVWTVSWTDKGIGYASSKDLINWSEQKYFPVMAEEDSARNCWAPEITCDPVTKTYMIYWATTIKGKFKETYSATESGYNHRIYYVTTKDFKTFSKTKLLYEPGFNVIDATIVRDGKRYIMFLKDETREPVQKNIKIAYADNLIGPYSKAGNPITGNYWAEGPTSVKVNNQWIVYFDKYRDHKYGAISSFNLIDWIDISDKISVPAGLRHGSILTVNDKIYNLLLKQ